MITITTITSAFLVFVAIFLLTKWTDEKQKNTRLLLELESWEKIAIEDNEKRQFRAVGYAIVKGRIIEIVAMMHGIGNYVFFKEAQRDEFGEIYVTKEASEQALLEQRISALEEKAKKSK